MSRLVVISNRVPPPGGSGAEAGGLAVALKAVLGQRGGLWLGWSGQTAEDEDSPERFKIHFREEGNILFALADLTQRDLDEYYNGFANRALWPLLHYRLDLADFDRQDLSGYMRVNAFFAKVLAERLEPTDTIWVQDYHLIPLAAELRARGIKNRIGFFLHIPWPPPDVWYAMPAHFRLLEAFTAYDLIGFQTEWDAENFALCLKREKLAKETAPGRFEAGSRAFSLGAFPIGIETREFAEEARKARGNALVKRMVASLEDRHLVIGVDRLDYSKGIDHRMLAYERFLQNNPAYHNKVTYLQITPKSRSDVPEYATMQAEVAGTAGRINGAFGHLDWTPIRYINRTIKRATLAGLYRMSDVGLVTPLRDGMNLVAKEFVAAQDGDDPGVLVLSRFAGAAAELSSALIVNPYDLDSTGNAIARALSMPREDRVARWRDMFDGLMKNDVSAWAGNFLGALEEKPQDAGLKAVS